MQSSNWYMSDFLKFIIGNPLTIPNPILIVFDYSLDICKDNFKNTYLIFKPNNSFIFPLKLPPYDNYALLFPSHQHGYEKTN